MVLGHYRLAREWVKMGHEVNIFASSYTHLRTKNPGLGDGSRSELVDGIRYHWIPGPTYSPENVLLKALSTIVYTLGLFCKRVFAQRPDVVICSSHHPLAIWPAYLLAKMRGAVLIFEVRDLWPLTLIELGGISKWNPLVLLMRVAQRFALRSSNATVSVLSHSKEYLVSKGLCSNKFHYIPNGVCFGNDEVELGAKIDLNNIKQSGRRLIGYAGKLGVSNDLETIIRALNHSHEKPKLCILGDGECKDYLINLVKELELEDQVYFFPPVPQYEVLKFLEQLDIAYIGIENSNIFRYGVSPTKLHEYLISGTPVLGAFQDPENIVNTVGCGINVGSEGPVVLSAAMDKLLLMSKEELTTMGEAGKLWVENNRLYEHLAKKFSLLFAINVN